MNILVVDVFRFIAHAGNVSYVIFPETAVRILAAEHGVPECFVVRGPYVSSCLLYTSRCV